MELSDFLNAINKTKEDVFAASVDPEHEERSYPSFVIARSLSYAPDALLWVNELNVRGTTSHGVTPRMHFDYLNNSLQKRNRFAKWQKPVRDETIELIMKVYRYNYNKAAQVVDLFNEEQIEALRKRTELGGVQKTRRE